MTEQQDPKVFPEERTEYNSTYYERHKEEIRRKRKERYLNDPEYRAKIKAQARARKRFLLREAKEDRERKGLPPPRRGVTKPTWFLIRVANRDLKVLMHTSGQLAKALKRKPVTIRAWEAKGIIPVALYRGKGGMQGNRLYTKFQIEELRKAFEVAIQKNGARKVQTRINSTIFPELAKEIWEKFPLGVDPDNLDLEDIQE